MFFSLLFCNSSFARQNSILVFAGAASKPPLEELAKDYEKKTGNKVEIVFGGSGYVLAQMILSKKGDIYFPGSSDYMELAKKKGAIFPETEKKVVYLVPSINVWKGNPQKIKSLRDLTKPNIKVAIANPEGVCVGLYAVEIIEKNFNDEEKKLFKKNLKNYTESCEKTATILSLKAVDAVIGWSVFQHWNPDIIETVPLKHSEIIRIGYIPIAISRYTNNKELAQSFIDFVLSAEGKTIFKKHHYFISPDEAFKWLGERKPVGGVYKIPEDWLKNN